MSIYQVSRSSAHPNYVLYVRTIVTQGTLSPYRSQMYVVKAGKSSSGLSERHRHVYLDARERRCLKSGIQGASKNVYELYSVFFGSAAPATTVGSSKTRPPPFFLLTITCNASDLCGTSRYKMYYSLLCTLDSDYLRGWALSFQYQSSTPLDSTHDCRSWYPFSVSRSQGYFGA
jgi:hypothetical protein